MNVNKCCLSLFISFCSLLQTYDLSCNPYLLLLCRGSALSVNSKPRPMPCRPKKIGDYPSSLLRSTAQAVEATLLRIRLTFTHNTWVTLGLCVVIVLPIRQMDASYRRCRPLQEHNATVIENKRENLSYLRLPSDDVMHIRYFFLQ